MQKWCSTSREDGGLAWISLPPNCWPMQKKEMECPSLVQVLWGAEVYNSGDSAFPTEINWKHAHYGFILYPRTHIMPRLYNDNEFPNLPARFTAVEDADKVMSFYVKLNSIISGDLLYWGGFQI